MVRLPCASQCRRLVEHSMECWSSQQSQYMERQRVQATSLPPSISSTATTPHHAQGAAASATGPSFASASSMLRISCCFSFSKVSLRASLIALVDKAGGPFGTGASARGCFFAVAANTTAAAAAVRLRCAGGGVATTAGLRDCAGEAAGSGDEGSEYTSGPFVERRRIVFRALPTCAGEDALKLIAFKRGTGHTRAAQLDACKLRGA
mmetsp:Transcript_42600/g.113873  ORF Transcript_42600/g.113873 Transcript_42600/m.113873 type:complete len:207 (-) Transcript_42600:15-635(-)